MFNIKFIKNIILDGGRLRALGRTGLCTRVFARQGDLDGSCTVYSLIMMLIFHQKLDWEDVTKSEQANENKFVDAFQREFLKDLKGLCYGGHTLEDISERLNLCYRRKLSDVYTSISGKSNSISRQELHNKIKLQLDERKPVQISYGRESGEGHSLVAIGYRKEGNMMRLFCLDPGVILRVMQIWNNVIEIDLLPSYNELSDINHYEEKRVYLHSILIINDNPPELDCPF